MNISYVFVKGVSLPYLKYFVVARSRSLVAEQLVQVGLLAPDDHYGRGGEDQHHEAWPHLAKREYRVTWRLLRHYKDSQV